MKDALRKSNPKQILSLLQQGKTGHSPAEECITTRYLLQALGEQRVLFWFSVAAGSVGVLLVVCVFICHATHTLNGVPAAAQTGLGLSCNAMAIIAYRQSLGIRQWATDLIIKTQLVHLAAPAAPSPALDGASTAPADEPSKPRLTDGGRRAPRASVRRAKSKEKL